MDEAVLAEVFAEDVFPTGGEVESDAASAFGNERADGLGLASGKGKAFEAGGPGGPVDVGDGAGDITRGADLRGGGLAGRSDGRS